MNCKLKLNLVVTAMTLCQLLVDARSSCFASQDAISAGGEPCQPDTSSDLEQKLGASFTAASQIGNLCEVVSDNGESRLMNGKLSAFWGYDFVGVDLAKEVLGQSKNSMKTVKIGTWEDVNLKDLPDSALSAELRKQKNSSQNNLNAFHGTMVANIIAGEAPFGIAMNASFSFVNANDLNSDPSTLISATEKRISQGIKIFQISTGSFKSHAPIFHELSTNGVISVRCAGNEYPLSEVTQVDPNESIIVGQLSATGGMEGTSQQYPGVTIAAPGRVYSRFLGKSKLFGGTSASQPVLTGCLSNVVSVLPDLTPKEAKDLVTRTAIPTLNSRQNPQLNGSGTLNCLKLAEVALRLAPQWPNSRNRIAGDDGLYDFIEDASKMEKLAQSFHSSHQNKCQRRAELDALRAAFLLNPNDKVVRHQIASIYRSENLPGNALTYESIDGLSDAQLISASKTFLGTDLELDTIRLAGERGGPLQILEQGLKSKDPLTVMLAASLGLGKLPRATVTSSLQAVFDTRSIDGYTLPYFKNVYIDQYHLSTASLLEKCRKWKPTSSDDEGPIVCGIIAGYSKQSSNGINSD